MEWSVEYALNELWSGLDATEEREVRRYLRDHLQAAFDAGRNQEAATTKELFELRSKAA
jgi:hypothetical protein